MFTRSSGSESSLDKSCATREFAGKSFQLIIHEFIIKTLSSVVAFESGYSLGMLETKGRYFHPGCSPSKCHSIIQTRGGKATIFETFYSSIISIYIMLRTYNAMNQCKYANGQPEQKYIADYDLIPFPERRINVIITG